MFPNTFPNIECSMLRLLQVNCERAILTSQDILSEKILKIKDPEIIPGNILSQVKDPEIIPGNTLSYNRGF